MIDENTMAKYKAALESRGSLKGDIIETRFLRKELEGEVYLSGQIKGKNAEIRAAQMFKHSGGLQQKQLQLEIELFKQEAIIEYINALINLSAKG